MHGENAKWSDGVVFMGYQTDASQADPYKECQSNTLNATDVVVRRF